MMGTIHALAGAAVASMAAGKSDRPKAGRLAYATVFIGGILSHYALDSLRHGHSGIPALDVACSFLIMFVTTFWLRPRQIYAAGTLGALFPDMVDMFPLAVEIVLGRTILLPKIFHYPWLDGRFNTGLDLTLLSILAGALFTALIVGTGIRRLRYRMVSNTANRGD